MIQNYLPILIFIGLSVLFGLVPLIAGFLIGQCPRPDPAKLSPYECGFDAFSDARMPFDIRFYVVAILFILFDLETAFLFPWAVSLRHIGVVGLISMGFFLFLLVIGFIYEWRKGALEWE